MSVCPKSAISMIEDIYGFVYPHVEMSKCIGCKLCERICCFNNDLFHKFDVKTSYVAVTKDDEQLKFSASGGVFATVAKMVIEKGGVVFGCALINRNGKLSSEHIAIENIKDLRKLQGSKYVQSSLENILSDIKREVHSGRLVLFSGTPCQAVACRSVVGDGKFSNMLIMDIICHGVPNARFFNSYILELEKRLNGKIFNFDFRDKKNGWGLTANIKYIDHKNVIREKKQRMALSSYYSLFLNSDIYRDSCYKCAYAGEKRIGDWTIGDYWGIQNEHPELLIENGGSINEKKGVSCIMINNLQGEQFWNMVQNRFNFFDSSFENIARHNGQLLNASNKGVWHDRIMEMYANTGYSEIEKWYSKQLGVIKYLYILWDRIPYTLTKSIKELKLIKMLLRRIGIKTNLTIKRSIFSKIYNHINIFTEK